MVGLARHRLSFPPRRGWAAGLVAVVVLAAPDLAAQKSADSLLLVPPTATRVRELEPPGIPQGGPRIVEVWRVEASPELMFNWYLRKLNRYSPVRDFQIDSTDVMPGVTTQASYHLIYHTYQDECADPPGATGDACKKWKKGEVKRRLLQNSRAGIDLGEWLAGGTITWFSRDAQGVLWRRKIEVKDDGVSEDWKRYKLLSLVIVTRDTLNIPAPPY